MGDESNRVKVPLIGGHAVELALAAIAVGHAVGMDLADMLHGLAEPGVQVRLLIVPGPNGSQMIDDTYNASTPSVMSALGLLEAMNPTRAIAVLGDMRELGEVAEREHVAVGRRAGEVADLVVTFGEMARTIAREAATTDGRFDAGPPAVTSFALEQREDLIALPPARVARGRRRAAQGIARLADGRDRGAVASRARVETSRSRGVTSEAVARELALPASSTSRPLDSRLLDTLEAGHGQHHAGRSESEHGRLAGAGGAGLRGHAHHRAADLTFLRLRKAAKQVRIDGPETHFVKTGTPTMGGIMVAASVVVITARLQHRSAACRCCCRSAC